MHKLNISKPTLYIISAAENDERKGYTEREEQIKVKNKIEIN